MSGSSEHPPNTWWYMHLPLIMIRWSSDDPSSPSCDGSVPESELPLIEKRFTCEGERDERRQVRGVRTGT